MKLIPPSIAARTMRIARRSFTCLSARCQPPTPIEETFSPVCPRTRYVIALNLSCGQRPPDTAGLATWKLEFSQTVEFICGRSGNSDVDVRRVRLIREGDLGPGMRRCAE